MEGVKVVEGIAGGEWLWVEVMVVEEVEVVAVVVRLLLYSPIRCFQSLHTSPPLPSASI